MAKQVILKRLTLTNFKGLRNVAIDFNGSVTTISGKNGTGKTTVIDGFNWLLFGKDSEGNSDTKFGIKTTDKNGAFIPHLDHEVSGTFEVTDTETGETETKIFRRVLVEEWKEEVNEETGESREYLKGHHTNYYYNEMPLKTKTEYDRIVAEIIPEAVFKVITNPSYFLTLHWQTQRDMLLQMAGEITDEQVIGSNPKFARLVELLQGKTLEGYQAKIKEDRAKIEADLQRIPTRIDEVTRNTPQDLDFTALEAQLTQLQAKYDELDKAMTSAAEANRQAYQQKQGVQQQINDLRTKQQNILFAAQQKANEEAHSRNAAYDSASLELATLSDLERNTNGLYEASKRRIEGDKSRAAEREQEYTKQQDETRNKWFKVNAEEFKDGEALICPLFKHGCADSNALQQYQQNQTAARETFDKDKAERLNAITKEGQKLGEQIKAQKAEAQRLGNELSELESKHEKDLADIKARRDAAELKKQQNPKQEARTVKGEDLPEWVELQSQIDALQVQLQAEEQPTENDQTAQLRQQRTQVQTEIDGVKAELQKKEQIEKAQKRIDELNQQKKELQKAKAQLQGKEDLLADFERAKMDEVERRVNALFRYVQFKMYRQQIEDEKQVSDCVCYIDGVRYADKNNAGKINAGLDVINTLCSFHKVNAPIFIDNAESVNEFIPVASQLITLVVTNGNFAVNNL